MRNYSIRLTDGTSKDVRADFAQIRNNDLLFFRQGEGKRAQLVHALAAGGWLEVAERCA